MFIVLVSKAVADGNHSDLVEHDRASTVRECMQRACFRGRKPLKLEPKDVVYIFESGKSAPVKIGFGANADSKGTPRWV
jgi:hypothetical protein